MRVNDRFQIEDARFAEMLWDVTSLKELVESPSPSPGAEEGEGEGEGEGRSMKEIWGGAPLGLNPNIRIYKYSPGQFFARHCMY